MPNFQTAVVSQFSLGPNGDYIPDGSGGYLMDGQTAYRYDRDYAKTAGQMRSKTGIRSFEIFESPTSGKYSLTMNQHILGGIYPTLDAAVGGLFGYFIRQNGSSASFEVFLSNLYTLGRGIFPENGGNVNVLESDASGLGSNLYNWTPDDPEIGAAADTVYVIFEKRAPGETAWTAFEVVTSNNLFNAAAGSTVQTAKDISRLNQVDYGDEYRSSLRSFDGLTVINESFAHTPVKVRPLPTLVKVMIDPQGSTQFTPSTSGGSNTFTYTATAYGTATDVVYTWSVLDPASEFTVQENGNSLQLTWTDEFAETKTALVSVQATSVSAAGLVNDSATFTALPFDSTSVLAFTVEVSGDPTTVQDLNPGGTAYYITDETGSVYPPGDSITYSQTWYREIPELTGLTLSNLTNP